MHILIVKMNVNHRAFDMRVAQPLTNVADIPVAANQLCRMTVPQHVSMKMEIVLTAVVPKHGFDRMAVQRPAVGWLLIPVPRVLLQHHKEMIRVEVMLQNE